MFTKNRKVQKELSQLLENAGVPRNVARKESALLRGFGTFMAVKKQGGDVQTAYQTVVKAQPDGSIGVLTMPGFLTLKPADAQAIFDAFAVWSWRAYLTFVTPNLVMSVDDTLEKLDANNAEPLCIVENMLQIRAVLLTAKEDENPYIVYETKITFAPLSELVFRNVAEAIMGYSLQIGLHNVIVNQNNKIVQHIAKIDKLLCSMHLSKEEQISVVGMIMVKNVDSRSIAEKLGSTDDESAEYIKMIAQVQTVVGAGIPAKRIPEVLMYVHSNANEMDWPLIMGFVYPIFEKALNAMGQDVAVIDAPPPVVKKWMEHAENQKHTVTFVFSNQWEAKLYHCCYKGSCNHVTFASQATWIGKTSNCSTVMMFSQGMAQKHIQTCRDYMWNNLTQEVDVIEFLPTYGHETLNMICNHIGTNQILSMHLLPLGIANSTLPSRKALVHYRLHKLVPVEKCQFRNYRLNDDNDCLCDVAEMPIEIDCKKLRENCTPRAIFLLQKLKQSKKTDTNRNQPEVYEFAPELNIYYRARPEASSKVNTRITAYLSEYPHQETRSALNRGKVIDGSEKSTTKFTVYESEQWLTGKYASKVRGLVVEQLAPAYVGKSVSLRFFWYINPEIDRKFTEEDRKSLVALLYTAVGFVPVDARYEVFEDAMEQSVGHLPRNEQVVYWSLLTVFLNLVEKSGLISSDWSEEWEEKSKKRERNRIAEVKNSLIKKSFTPGEMQQILQCILERLKDGQSEYLAPLIRMVTGLDASTVAGLQWRDFVLLGDHGIYQIWVARRYEDKEGVQSLRKAEHYRRIPCIPLLTEYLLQQKVELLKVEKNLQNVEASPIVTTAEYMADEEKRMSMLSPKLLTKLTKEAIKAAGVSEEFLPIPVGSGRGKLNTHSYHGDIFRMNYDFYLRNNHLDGDEIAYLQGNQPKTTFWRNYYDPQADLSQFCLWLKLLKWHAMLMPPKVVTPQICMWSTTGKSTTDVGTDFLAIIRLPKGGDKVAIVVASHFGLLAMASPMEQEV